MKTIYNAIYFIIFVQFVRSLVDKIMVPFTTNIIIEHHDGADEFYVMVNEIAFYWTGDVDEATAFIYSAVAKRHSLAGKMKILETSLDMVLQDSACITGLTIEEMAALDKTVDEFGE